MSSSLKIIGGCVLFVAAIIAISAKAKRNTGQWPDGYSADFNTINKVDSSKNCAGRLYVNTLWEPRGVRRDSTCGGKVRSMIWLQRGGTFVLDPEKKAFWKPRMAAHLDVGVSATGRTFIGREELHGRSVERYEQSSDSFGKREPATVWEDPRLHAAVRVITPTTMFELSEIREGRQPKSLFVVPEGYAEVAPPFNE
jgi:hypothetical protein